MREQTPGPSLRHEKGHTLVLVLLFLSEFWDPFGRLVLWFMFQTVVSEFVWTRVHPTYLRSC